MSKQYKVGIVGATGAVGQELIRLLVERNFPYSEIVPLASARSAGKTVSWKDKSWIIQEATPSAFEGLDIAIFSAGGNISKELGPIAAKAGCVVIDNSSAFRMDENVPLVVPEINAEAAKKHQGIIANPNCSTAISLMALAPLHKAFGLKSFFASTYQAVSGSGVEGIQELEAQVHAYVNKEESEPKTYPHPIAFNLIPHVDAFQEDGYTKEEYKMLNESKKILELPELKVSTTCVRVPVFRAHSISINASFEKPVDLAVARQAIEDFPGVELCDDPSNNIYPLPRDYTEKENCGVGRIRKDLVLDNGLSFWVVGDQVWKGAALNAVQITECLCE